MSKKRKIKKGRIFTLLFLIIVVGVLFYFAYQKWSSNSKDTKKVKDISTIKGYGYTLRENATDYYKGLFKKLSKVLSSDNVDMDEYASLECQMFVSDFFNLDNKISKSDVGGTEFVYSPYKLDFSKYAMDSVYKSVLSNVYGNRKQKLPVVSKTTCEKVRTESFKYGDSSDDNAYVFNFDVKYKEDMNYQSKGSLTIIHSDKKLEVASMSEDKVN